MNIITPILIWYIYISYSPAGSSVDRPGWLVWGQGIAFPAPHSIYFTKIDWHSILLTSCIEIFTSSPFYSQR